MRYIMSLLILMVMMTGCFVPPAPQTADEFRNEFIKAGVKDSFVVDQSFKKVTDVIEKNTPKCLQVAVVSKEQRGYGEVSFQVNYNPTVIPSKGSTELYLQINSASMRQLYDNKLPEKGMYALVVDATPEAKGKSRIDMYKMGSQDVLKIANAVKNWVTGKSNSCPDLAD